MKRVQVWGMPMNPQSKLWPVVNVALVTIVPQREFGNTANRIYPPTPPPDRVKRERLRNKLA